MIARRFSDPPNQTLVVTRPSTCGAAIRPSAIPAAATSPPSECPMIAWGRATPTSAGKSSSHRSSKLQSSAPGSVSLEDLRGAKLTWDRYVLEAVSKREAIKLADTIAAMSLPSVMAAKEAINRAFETPLAEGIRFERRMFHALFATEDQKEGMRAFVDKDEAKFTGR